MEFDSIIRLLLDDQVSEAIQGTAESVQSAFTTITQSAQEAAASMTASLSSISEAASLQGTTFVEAMGGMGSVAMETGSGITSSINTLSGAFVAPFAFMGNQIEGLIAHMRWASLFIGMISLQIGKSILSMAENTENSRIKFDTLFGSTAKGEDMMQFLTKLSLQSTVTRQSLEEMAGKFAGIGMTFDQAKQATIGLNDAIVALGLSQSQANGVARNLADIYNRTIPLARNYTNMEMDGIQVGKLLADAIKDHTLNLNNLNLSTGTATGVVTKHAAAVYAASEALKYASDLTISHADAVQRAIDKQDNFNTSISHTKNTIQGYQDQITKANRTIDEHNSLINQTYNQQLRNNTVIANAKDSIAGYNTKISEANDRIGQLTEQQKLSQGTVDSATASQGKYNDSLTKAQGTIDKYSGSLQQTAQSALVTQAATGRLTDEQIKQIGTMENGQKIAMALSIEMEKMYSSAALAHANTMQGLLTSTFDALQLITQSIMGITVGGTVLKGGIFDNLKTSIEGFVNFVRGHINDISNFFNAVGKSLATSEGGFAAAGLAIGVFLGFLGGILAPVITVAVVFGGLGAVLGLIVDKMGGVNNIIKVAAPYWHALADGAKAAFNALEPGLNFINAHKAVIIGGILGILGAFTVMVAYINMGVIPSFIAGAWAAITFWAAVFAPLVPFLLLGAAIGVVIALIITHWKLVSSVAETIGAAIATFFTKTVPDALKATGTFIGHTVDGIVKWFQELPGKVYKFVSDLFITKIPFAIGFMIGFILFSLPRLELQFINSILSIGIKTAVEIGTWAMRFGGLILVMIYTILGYIAVWITEFVNAVVGLGLKIITEIGTWPKKIKDWLEHIPTNTKTMLSDLGKIFIDGLGDIYKTITGWVSNVFKSVGQIIDVFGKIASAFGKGVSAGAKLSLPGYALGGIVPGAIGEPQLAVVHGGETIIPPGSGGQHGMVVNINLTGDLVVDSDQRINYLAQRIGQVLGRQNELTRYGAGW